MKIVVFDKGLVRRLIAANPSPNPNTVNSIARRLKFH